MTTWSSMEIDGKLKMSSRMSPRFAVSKFAGCTYAEANHWIEIVEAAQIQSLIERGVLKLGVVTLYLRVNKNGELYVARKDTGVLEDLLENNIDKYNLMEFLEPRHIRRLRMIKENYGQLQENND